MRVFVAACGLPGPASHFVRRLFPLRLDQLQGACSAEIVMALVGGALLLVIVPKGRFFTQKRLAQACAGSLLLLEGLLKSACLMCSHAVRPCRQPRNGLRRACLALRASFGFWC